MNKLIGSITNLRDLEFETKIYESGESRFISIIRCDMESDIECCDFFYDIKAKGAIFNLFHISKNNVSISLPPKLYDKKNSYPKSPLSREEIVNSRGLARCHNIVSALQLLEIFPFLEKEIKSWIVFFGENREIRKEDVNDLLTEFFLNRRLLE